MRKNIFTFLFMILILNSFAIDKNKVPSYLKPSSISFNLFFSPFFNLYNPEFKGLSFAFATTFDIANSFQYRFSKFIGLEGGISFNLGFDFTESKYIELDNIVTYSQNTFSFFMDIPLNLMIYIPLEKELKNNYHLNFIIKSGLILDLWLYSFYRIEKNYLFLREGSFHDDIIDGPNQFNRYTNYFRIINPVNLGLNLSFIVKLYSNKWVSFYPECGARFFLLPTLYGYNERIGGYDLLLSRNNGINDKSVLDFKIQIYAGIGISVDFGNHNDNLYDILKQKNNKD
ncbi:MAG TPA: hypothetical protein PK351_06645 [Spirochaetota bacterium]|nr:hypothetical protein [Spirochaetota bacterium]HPP04488.1 hypothetical protein [Spirochaetota bacterium]